MKKSFVKCILLATACFLSVTGCKKGNDVTPQNIKDQSKTEELILVEADITSADNDIEEAEDASGKRVSQLCFTSSIKSDTLNPVPGFEKNYRMIVLSYTAGDCDSLQRTGSITIYKSGSILAGNYHDSVIYNNFNTNGRSLTGYRTYKLSSVDLKDLVVSYSSNLEVTYPSGNFIHINSQGEKKFVGYMISALTSVETTGSTKIVDQNGDLISVSIDDALVYRKLCASRLRFPIKGIVSYTNTRTNTKTVVDYGNGTCDRIAKLTVNDSTRTIYLR